MRPTLIDFRNFSHPRNNKTKPPQQAIFTGSSRLRTPPHNICAALPLAPHIDESCPRLIPIRPAALGGFLFAGFRPQFSLYLYSRPLNALFHTKRPPLSWRAFRVKPLFYWVSLLHIVPFADFLDKLLVLLGFFAFARVP